MKAVAEAVRWTVSGQTISPPADAKRSGRCARRSASPSVALGVAERRACRILGQPRSTPRRVLRTAEDEERLNGDIVALATTCGRYGCRRITALLRQAGWAVNARRVERIRRREG